MLTLQEKIEIVLICGETMPHRRVADIFNGRHPLANPICHTTVGKIMKKFKQSGSVDNLFKKPHNKWKTNDETALNVLLDVTEHGKTSLSQVSQRTDVSSTSVATILKRNKFHPYKPRFVNTLKERDYIPRFEFSAWFQGEVEETRLFPRQILWSDEATFTSNGTVSSQNCRWWARENPNFIIECRDQYSFKTNVWCGILNNRLIGPFFFRQNLNGERYLHLLEGELSDILEDMPPNIRQTLWYQQDGASIHTTLAVRRFLDRKFGRKWIGRYSNYPWPARSPDLTPLDFFLWGYLKSKVYLQRPFRDLDHLENTIRECAMAIPQRFLINAVKEVSRRTIICMERDGRHTEVPMH